MPNIKAPKHKVIAGQPHELSYINNFEKQLLKAIGGAGQKTKEGVPAYFLFSETETSGGDSKGLFGGIGKDLQKGYDAFMGNTDGWSDKYGESYDAYRARTDATKKRHAELNAKKKRSSGPKVNQAAIDARASNQQMADDYNAQIADLNERFGGFSSRFNDLSGSFGGQTYLDYYDDPMTEADERAGFTTAMDNLRGLQSDFGGANFDVPDLPDFITSAGGETIAAPELTAASDYSGLGQNISDLLGVGQGIIDERGRREREYGRISGDLGDDLSTLDRQLGRLNYYDTDLIDSAEDDYFRMLRQAEKRAEGDALYDQLGFDYDNYGIVDDIGKLRQDYRAEEDRIGNFSKDLLRDYGLYGDEFGDYDIRNLDELNALDDAISGRIRDARYFDSPLDYDFSREIDDLKRLRGDVGGMLDDREAELRRISDAERDALTVANQLDRMGDTTGIYNLADINELQQQLDAANRGISDFDSVLDYDFANTTDPLAAAQADIDALRNSRSAALDLIENPLAGLQEDLAGADLYDEDAMRDIDNRLADLGIDLASFTGGRVTGIDTKIKQAMGAVDGRLRELEQYREGVEATARELQQEVEEMEFITLDSLEGSQEKFAAQQKEAELYNAIQALDELKAVETRLADERARLEQDAANVAAREGAAADMVRDQMVQQLRANPEMIDPSALGDMTVEEYLAMLGNNEEENTQNTPIGTFGQNVMIGA